jgi:chromate transporter
MPEKPSFKEAFLFWLKLGFISFGGPAGQIAIMHEFLVEKKKWISESRFMHALNYCMLLPGPEAQQMASYSGWLLHGVRGGLVAGILFVLPSVFILLALSILYVLYGNIPVVMAVFNGLKPAVIAIVMLAMFKIGKKSLLTLLHFFIAALSFIAIFFFNIPFPLIILTTLITGLLITRYKPTYLNSVNHPQQKDKTENDFYINTDTVVPYAGYNRNRVIRQLLMGILLWLLPFALMFLFIQDTSFWITIGMFFTKAALVTFGGAYAVLPYVAQVSVEKFHWLNQLQMLDGLALGETTPGPLIMVLAFVGFMAGYDHYGASLLFATVGLMITVWFTFLPCFLFILIGAPIIERTQHRPGIKNILGFVSAAVVGVILNLSIYLLKAVVVSNGKPDWFGISWIIISLLALHYGKINMILWIAISGLAGLGYLLAFL